MAGHTYAQPMPSPLRALHVFLAAEQITHLKLKAARRHLTVSALVRELVDRDMANEERAKLRKKERR